MAYEAVGKGDIELAKHTIEELGSNAFSEALDELPSSPSPFVGSDKQLSFKFHDIQWNHVNFTVNEKSILSNCWGKVGAGEVCAIMGPSGAGKSSILNVLAGRSASASGIDINGVVKVGGKTINPVQFRRQIAYVMQDDALMATQTPEEALRFSASLRLPPETSREAIDSLVTQLLKDLGLTGCKDVLIGGPMIKGISGGQKKRVSIGIELITNPKLLFLDEPTSGLDSHSAFTVIQLVKSMAKRQSAVLLTIHQPSSEIFYLFDIVVYMVNGRVFWQGPVSKVVSDFNAMGYACPPNYNPCDFVMALCQQENKEEFEKRGLYSVPHSVKTDEAIEKFEGCDECSVRASYFKQIEMLMIREFTSVSRNTGALGARYGVTIIINLIYGFIFLNAGGKDNADPQNFNSHFGALTMIAIAAMFGTAQPAMLEFPFERPMFMREYVTGTYTALPYFLSKTIMEIPLVFLQCIVQFIIVYFMINFQGNYILLVLACFGLGIVSSSVAVAMGCFIPDVKNVTEFAPLMFVPQILFAGFFIQMSHIPVFLRWAQYLCGLKYCMNILISVEFDRSSDSCTRNPSAAAACDNVQSYNNVDPDLCWLYAVLMVVLFIGFRGFGAIALVQKSKRFY